METQVVAVPPNAKQGKLSTHHQHSKQAISPFHGPHCTNSLLINPGVPLLSISLCFYPYLILTPINFTPNFNQTMSNL